MKHRLLLIASPAALVLAATALSYSKGALPGTTGIPGTVPNTVVRTGQGCAQCHSATAGVPLPHLEVSPTQYSLDAGQAIQITSTTTGGVSTSTWGGFVAEVTRGALAAGSMTKTDPAGKFITHSFAFFGRSWQYGYTAPATPGLVELYTGSNTADGDGTENGDQWAFFGDSQQQSVPVRLFVNSASVTDHGAGCAGGTGVTPVLGSAQTASVGNPNFNLEVHGAPPAVPCVFVFGANPTFQVDLGLVGVTGCTLWVQPLLQLGFGTTPGTPALADGTAVFPVPIPNRASLVGATLEAQCLLVDVASGRQTPLTLTNAVSFTIQ